jgi:hypothetical protein
VNPLPELQGNWKLTFAVYIHFVETSANHVASQGIDHS